MMHNPLLLPTAFACILPALVTLTALQCFKSFRMQPQGIQTFLSILNASVVLELGTLLILKLMPSQWLSQTDTQDLILTAAISTIPLTLVTFATFSICKKVYFAEQSQRVLLELSMLVTIITLAFIALGLHKF